MVDQALTFSGGEKERFIKKVCREHPSISAEVLELMEGIEESRRTNFLDDLWEDQKNILFEFSEEFGGKTRDENFLNEKVGPYRISEIIGQGGMATVFKASRIDGQFHRDVAIKIIKSGLSDSRNVHRFQVEKEILAGLQHPNIAHIYDGGITKDGSPYLVMEFIDGVPIDTYSNNNKLTIKDRLVLFQEVCSAVHYAHKNLIVHRDLKAQNIYVTKEGIVKILDFGIAKLLNPELQHVSGVETLTGQRAWTPHYAAPEQVNGETVTIATDIYALGILLHHLLTGSYPHHLDDKTLSEIEETIINSSPLLPSHTVGHIPDPEKIAGERNTTPLALKNHLRGDLDSLVSKAIRKEPEYRYQSATQLSEDIYRYRSGRPLIARQGTLRYRAGKFMRRNRAALSIAAIFILSVSLFGGYYSWRITQERNNLEQVVEFMTRLIESGNPGEIPGGALTGRMLLEKGVEEAQLLDNQPEVQAHVFNTAGNVHLLLGEYEEAEKLFSEAVQIHEKVLGGNAPELAKSLNNLAVALTRQSKYEVARDMHQRAMNIQLRNYGEEHPDVAKTYSLFGSWIPVTDIHEAARMREKALEIRRKIYGDQHLEVALSYLETGRIKRALGMPEEAIKDFLKSIKIRELKLGRDHPEVAEGMILLGDIYRLYEMNVDSAEILYREALSILDKRKDSYNPDLLHVLGSYAVLLSEKGDHDTAQQLLQKSLEIRKAVFGPHHLITANGVQHIANQFYRQGNYNDAEDHYRNLLKLKKELLGTEHLSLSGIYRDLGKTLTALNKFEEAEYHLRKALQLEQEKNDVLNTAYTFGLLATLNAQQDELQKAKEMYERAISIYEENGLLNHYNLIRLRDEFENVQMAELNNR